MNNHNQSENESIVRSWNLSESTNSSLLKDPGLTKYLIAERAKYPFPTNFTPNSIEIYLDRELAFSFIDGILLWKRPEMPQSQPVFLEWKFNNECACFQINSELVINRIEFMAAQNTFLDLNYELTTFPPQSSPISQSSI